MRTRYIERVYPALPLNSAEAELSRDFEIYYQAIHSYPDHFARTHVTFEKHLSKMLALLETGSQDSGREYFKVAS